MGTKGQYEKESKLETEIRLYAEARGCLFYKWIGAVGGVPDRILVTPKGTVFVETKARRGTLRALQEFRRDEILSAGGNYILAKSFDDVKEWFNDIDK